MFPQCCTPLCLSLKVNSLYSLPLLHKLNTSFTKCAVPILGTDNTYPLPPLNVGRLSFNTRCNPFANSSASAVSSKYRADTMVLLLFQDIRRYQIYPFLHKAQIERILRSNPTLVCRVVEGVPHFVLQRGD